LQDSVLDRRQFCRLAGGMAVGLSLAPTAAVAKSEAERRLKLYNLHTGERLAATYWAGGHYDGGALSDIDWLLRDFRTDEQIPIDRKLLDVLYRLQQRLDTTKPFHIISGYRSPATNAKLRANSNGVAKRSLHMRGMAIDVRIPGHRLKDVRRAALDMRAGGVGYYPKSDFVHLDTGRVRFW
jgi:uncharacterized protein YcbK (DUF882 family)